MNPIQTLLKQLRDNGWTEQAIAAELGVHAETVSRYFRGCRFPSQPKLVRAKLEELLQSCPV